MKQINNIIRSVFSIVLTTTLASCNDYLDQSPLSLVTPEKYLTEESQLAAYANGLYPTVLPSHSGGYGSFGEDRNTDNMASKTYDNKYVPGQWKVEQNDANNWNFSVIYSCNYFLGNVLPKWKSGEITGNKEYINHYIGEIYFLRAHEYFKRMQLFGDYPIIRDVLPDQMEPLVEASKRAPHTEVARFIISDLDSAIVLMANNPDKNKNRISKEVALLFKSRVALYEGTWLKYFKNTAFVPNGPGWPGKEKEYNASYTFQSGDIDAEIDYFLSIAMESAKLVADNVQLVSNNGILQQSVTDPINPYVEMFSDVDMSGYSEVLLWRQYNKGLGVTHNVPVDAQHGNYGIGLTRGMVDGFLMNNGLPVYVFGSGYAGDETIFDVRKDRDDRLTLFLKEPGQKNILYESSEGDFAIPIEPYPEILKPSAEGTYSTGYSLRKGGSFDQAQCVNGGGFTGSITFRGVEAYLNYIEACYEKTGSIDNTASAYWKAIRRRANVNEDYNLTIAATNMAEEAKNDWGAYSAGSLIDATLYNIRRERRCELMAEALRFMDLKRWRAMDQMMTTPYHIEGFKLWGTMQDWYKDKNGTSQLIYGRDLANANVSSPELSKYLRPYEINSKSLAIDGYKWTMAHYLYPIAMQHFMISAGGGDVSNSPIYQNPGWPMVANQGATDIK